MANNTPVFFDFKVEYFDKHECKVTFEIANAHRSIPNSIRRTMNSDIPTMAIDIIEPAENNTTMCDEMISHRLGLLPFWSDGCDEDLYYRANCECGGILCDKCSIRYRYTYSQDDPHEVGVGSDRNLVRSPKIQRASEKLNPIVSEDRDRTIIHKCRKGEEVNFICYALKGTADEHAKWQAVVNPVFSYRPKVTFNKKATVLLDIEEMNQL